MRQLNQIVIPTKATATTTTAAIDAENLFAVSVQAVSTGTAAGACKLQASNDNPQDATAPANWADISGATVTVTGTAGSFIIPKTEICYQYIRVVYTSSGGTGNITVTLKALGA